MSQNPTEAANCLAITLSTDVAIARTSGIQDMLPARYVPRSDLRFVKLVCEITVALVLVLRLHRTSYFSHIYSTTGRSDVQIGENVRHFITFIITIV